MITVFLQCCTRVKNITSCLYSALNIPLEVDELADVPKRRPTKPQYCSPHDTWTNNLIPHKRSILSPIHLFFQSWSCLHSNVSFMLEQLFSFRRLQPRSCIIRHDTRMQTEDDQKGRKSTDPSFSAYATYFAGAFFNMAAFFNCVYLYWVNRDFGWTYFRLIVNSIKFVFDEIKFRWKVFSIKFFSSVKWDIRWK